MANLFRCGSGSGGGAKVFYLGEGATFDIPTLLPDVDYTLLTEDNFIVGVSALGGGTSSRSSTSGYMNLYVESKDVSKTFDTATGVLTISGYSQRVDLKKATSGSASTSTIFKYVTLTHTIQAYLVIGEIEDVSTTE